MAGTFSSAGGNTTGTFLWTKPKTITLSVITAWAHYLHHGSDFDTLTNQQKVDIVDAWIRKQGIAMAKTYDIQVAKDVAEAEAVITANANIDL